jgi:hypothetical protein
MPEIISNISEPVIKCIDILLEQPQNTLALYFSRRTTRRYISFAPVLSDALQREIIPFILNPLRKRLEWPFDNYDPCEITVFHNQFLERSKIPNIIFFLESISNENVFTDMKELKLNTIDFYCIEIPINQEKLYLFKKINTLRGRSKINAPIYFTK